MTTALPSSNLVWRAGEAFWKIALASSPRFTGGAVRVDRMRSGQINRLIGKWPGAVRTRISTVLLLSFRLRQPPRAVADEHLFEFGAGTGRDVRDH